MLTDLLGQKVLYVVLGFLAGSTPEPSHFEHESLVLIVPISDKVVGDRLDRFTIRRGDGRDPPCGQRPGPIRVALWLG